MAKWCFVLLLCIISRAEPKKNVLFIVVDDLRTQLGAYGESTKTPSLDNLASTSMVFERAYVQLAVCSPSRTSVLTGRRPDSNHAWRNTGDEYWRLHSNATSMPQYFKENGYRAIGMGKVYHPGGASGSDDKKYSWSVPYFHAADKVDSPNSWACFKNIEDNVLRDGQLADKAVETLNEIKKNRTKGDDTPFFLAVGFHRPHLPLHIPAKYCDLYPEADKIPLANNMDAPKYMPPIAWNPLQGLADYADTAKYKIEKCEENAAVSINDTECHISDSDAQAIRRAYYAGVSFTDAQIGRVLQELKKQDFADKTITVMWADHGWKLGEHNMWGKFTNFEDDTHVPFMLRVPGVTDHGMRTNALVELVDIFPTLTDLAGIDVPTVCPEDKSPLTCVEGTSVAPLLKDPKMEWKKAAFSQYPRPSNGLASIPGKPSFKPESVNHLEDVMGYALRTDTYRFVEWYSFDRTKAKPNFDDVWGTELYDHTNATTFFDDENTNIASEKNMTDTVKELRKILQAGWRNIKI